MTTQGHRLKEIRQALGLSGEAFGKIIGVSRQYVSNLEADRNTLNNEKFVSLLLDNNVNLNYLLGGIGQMFIEVCENTHKMRKNNTPELNFKNWGNRLAKILSENKETTYSFSKRTGIPEHRIERFILDSIEPTIKELNSIKSNVDISIDELLYGEIVEKSTQEDDVCLSANEILKLKELLKNS